MNVINPVALLSVNKLFTQFETVNVFGEAIQTWIIVILLTVLLSVLFQVIILIKQSHNKRAFHTEKRGKGAVLCVKN